MAYHTSNSQMTKVFMERLRFNFHTHCEEAQLTPDVDNFLAYLVDQGIIGRCQVWDYGVREAFRQYYPAEGQYTKEEAVAKFAKQFTISVKGAWRILQRVL